MVKFAMALFFILFSDLIMAKTLLIETESSEEENGNFIEKGNFLPCPLSVSKSSDLIATWHSFRVV